jgi:hypothetical protein
MDKYLRELHSKYWDKCTAGLHVKWSLKMSYLNETPMAGKVFLKHSSIKSNKNPFPHSRVDTCVQTELENSTRHEPGGGPNWRVFPVHALKPYGEYKYSSIHS